MDLRHEFCTTLALVTEDDTSFTDEFASTDTNPRYNDADSRAVSAVARTIRQTMSRRARRATHLRGVFAAIFPRVLADVVVGYAIDMHLRKYADVKLHIWSNLFDDPSADIRKFTMFGATFDTVGCDGSALDYERAILIMLIRRGFAAKLCGAHYVWDECNTARCVPVAGPRDIATNKLIAAHLRE